MRALPPRVHKQRMEDSRSRGHHKVSQDQGKQRGRRPADQKGGKWMKTQATDMTARTLEPWKAPDKGRGVKSERRAKLGIMCCSSHTKQMLCKQAKGWEGKTQAKTWLGLERPKCELRRHLNTLPPRPPPPPGRPDIFSLLTALLKGKWN